MPRATDQYGTELALRRQLEVRTGRSWDVVGGTGPAWRTAPSHVHAADLIAGQREDHTRFDPAVHDASFDDSSWAPAVAREVGTAIVGLARPAEPPGRGDPAGLGHAPVRRDAFIVVDLGQNINGWVRLTDLGPAGTAGSRWPTARRSTPTAT